MPSSCWRSRQRWLPRSARLRSPIAPHLMRDLPSCTVLVDKVSTPPISVLFADRSDNASRSPSGRLISRDFFPPSSGTYPLVPASKGHILLLRHSFYREE